MTICKTLATAEHNGITVTAKELLEKFAVVPHYEITVSRAGELYVTEVYKTARTTWKNRYKEICRQYGIK